jgi:putative ABC transport system substrate-binding protein
MPLVGYLYQGSANPFGQQFAADFRRGLNKVGWVEDQNVQIEYRWADNRLDQLPALAVDLVRRDASVIAAAYSPAAIAAKAATSAIPIVFLTGTDPIRDGLVTALNRPGGNVTGMAFSAVLLGAKRLGLLHDLLPAATTFALFFNPTNRLASESYLEATQTAAHSLGLQLVVLPASSEREISNGFTKMVEQRIAGLIVPADTLFGSRQDQIVGLAARHSIPTMYFQREAAVAGGLTSYGTNFSDAFREVGMYAGRMLKGERAADLPVIQPAKFEFVINLKTATTLGLTIPPDVLSIADEVIE